MSFKLRIIIPMMVMVIVAATAILVANIVQFSNFVNTNIKTDSDKALLDMLHELDLVQADAYIALLHFIKNHALLHALESHDRETLLQNTLPVYSEAGVDECTITDSNGMVLVRAHAPDIYGDSMTFAPGIETALIGQPAMRFETDADGNGSVFFSTPLYDDRDVLIGAIMVGRRLDSYTYIRTISNVSEADMVMSFITTGILITMVLLFVSVPLIWLVTVRISTPITRMLEKVHYDGLTGIFNRRYFDEKLKQIMSSMSRSGDKLSLMMIDVDNFKQYNDTYGHSEGDKCLKTVATILSGCITRSSDFVARYGGEEFVVVLPYTDENGARMLANKMLLYIRGQNIPHENNMAASCVTVSIGVITGTVIHTQTGDDYVKLADAMLYKSKFNGRNRYTFAVLGQ